MSLVIATGLTIGSLFSLYVVPVFYSYIAEIKERLPEGSSDDHGHHA